MTTENKQTNLCNTCQNSFAECNSKPVFGVDDNVNDIVIECDNYQMTEEEKTRLEFEEFKKGYPSLTEDDAKDLFEAKKSKFEKDIEEKNKQDRQLYRQMMNDFVEEKYPKLIQASKNLSELKKEVYNDAKAIIDLKQEIGLVKNEDQNEHTFSSFDGKQKISVGSTIVDDYDDLVDDGIFLIEECLNDLATDEKSKKFVNLIRHLLAKNKKGNLKASRVIMLRQHAEELGDKRILQGVKIIEESYKPRRTKQYVRAKQKDEMGAFVDLPLAMTEA